MWQELQRSVTHRTFPNGSPHLPPLADPAHCAQFWGTRDDELIPTALVDSVGSGLISTTLALSPVDSGLHGAVFHSQLADHDLTTYFLDMGAAELNGSPCGTLQTDMQPTWHGRRRCDEFASTVGESNLPCFAPGKARPLVPSLGRVAKQVTAAYASAIALG